MLLIKYVVCFFIGSLLSVSVFAQDVDFKSIDKKINELMTDWKIPGCSIAIVKDSSIIYSKGYGFRDLELKQEATENTVYGIASCSKAFTTASLGLLADEKKLAWDKPIYNYMPDFILSDPYITANITALDLVTHRSGYASNDFLWYKSSNNRKDLMKLMRHLNPTKSFRSYYQYNNLMYVAAGELIERISGITWEEYVKQKLFTPLEMKNSSLSINDINKFNDVASRYRIEKDKLLKIEPLDADNIGSAGSINSTVSDMGNWLIMHLNKGKFKGKQIISQEQLAFIHKPAMAVHTPLKYPELYYSSYALGWYVTAYKGNMLVRHSGALDGVSTLTSFMPQKGLGVVIIVNLDGSYLFNLIASYYIFDKLTNAEPTDWNERYLTEVKEDEKKAKESEIEESQKLGVVKPAQHLFSEYEGLYNNTPFGKISVELNDTELFFTYNGVKANLKHITCDIFEVDDIYVFGNMKIRFETDEYGKIKSVNVPLESSIDELKFVKE